MKVCPAQRDCWLRCRELLPQAGIMDLSASSVGLEIEIYEDCVSTNGCGWYIINYTYDNFHMGVVECLIQRFVFIRTFLNPNYPIRKGKHILTWRLLPIH